MGWSYRSFACLLLCIVFDVSRSDPGEGEPLSLTAPSGAAVEAESPTVKAWGVLFQVMKAIEACVASGELTAVHNEDSMLGGAIWVLQGETRLVPAAQQENLKAALVAFGKQIGALHEAADAFDQARVATRLKEVRANFAALQRSYGKQVLTAGRRWAERSACPMHREVTGKSTDLCPKCGMSLDQPIRIPLLVSGGGMPAMRTVQASIRLDGPLEAGKEVKGALILKQLTGAPVLITDLRTVHTQKIHLLIIDTSLTDYHHVHPQLTAVPGEYAFSFAPQKPGPYRAWGDLRTTFSGFQEYVMTDMPAATNGEPLADKRVQLHGETGELRGDLVIDTGRIKAGDPGPARLRVTDAQGRPFKELEPVMATFAHLVAFNEDRRTVLHIHPKGAEALLPSDRGGPELEFQLYATEPGYYRLFAQVQVKGEAKFIPFGVTVEP